ncbi:MAG: hypothetical protein IJO97_00080 [Lachnospiraceae bacterium]|nr:hypothetical protein [Lachnospiraceae bacterium]
MKLLTLAPIFQSNMVLQRGKPITIWGNAPVGTVITLTLSGTTKPEAPVSTNQTIAETNTATASTDGTWKCVLPAMDAGENFTLKVTCKDSSSGLMEQDETIILRNISIGDIWLACGQSNMEFFLRYDADWESVQKYEKNPKIHMYNVPQLAFPGHQKNTTGYGYWFTEGETGFETFSAPGYSFARNIQPEIGVPIGIIGCNWGGTTASTWLDESYLQQEPLSVYLKEYENAISAYTPRELKEISLRAWKFEDSPQHAVDFMPLLYGRDREWQENYMKEHEKDPVIPMGPWNINRPGGLYHQMLEPLIPFAFKGVLWYQGESDAIHAEMYDKLLTSLISCWRKKWNDNFPFLFVQLAPFGVWLACDSTGYTQVREKQELVSKTVPNTGMISIMDIGSYYDIHPKQKLEVGRRLALLARGKVYGESILCESPELICAVRDAHAHNKITLSFSNCRTLVCDDNKITGFVLIQQEKEIPIDSVSIEDTQIILQAEALTDAPCTVSFAWADYVTVNVHNEAGLPVKPFRRGMV